MDDQPATLEELSPSDQAWVRQLSTVDELRVIADPRRWAIHSRLIRYELSVKELAAWLGEPQKRLYHHIGELERVGLIQVTRTELRNGIVQKFYRATSRWLDVSPSLMHYSGASEEVQAATDWYLNLLRMTAANLQQSLTNDPSIIGGPLFWTSFNGVRLSPDRARELARRIAALHEEFVDNAPPLAIDEPGERISLTIAMLPWPPPPTPVDHEAGND